MIIKRIVADHDGNIEATLALDRDQAQFLLNVGIATLVAQGALVIQDMTKEEFEAEIAKAGETDSVQTENNDPITIN